MERQPGKRHVWEGTARSEDAPLLRSIPRLDKGFLRLVGIRLGADFLDADACAVFGDDNVLLLHLLDAPISELAGVEEDLDGRMSRCDAMQRECANLVANPGYAAHDSEQNGQRDKIGGPHVFRLCTAVCGGLSLDCGMRYDEGSPPARWLGAVGVRLQHSAAGTAGWAERLAGGCGPPSRRIGMRHVAREPVAYPCRQRSNSRRTIPLPPKAHCFV